MKIAINLNFDSFQAVSSFNSLKIDESVEHRSNNVNHMVNDARNYFSAGVLPLKSYAAFEDNLRNQSLGEQFVRIPLHNLMYR